MTPPNKIERRNIKMKYEGKYFLIGAIFGGICFLLWDFVFSHYGYITDLKEYSKLEEFKQDSEEKLLSYINGQWISSVGDVVIKMNIDKSKDFIIVEIEKEKRFERSFKIHQIQKVNGLLGIVNFDICEKLKSCNKEQLIPIQINKIFGLDRTISLSYDSRLTYCVDADDTCTRAFKRVN